MTTSSILSRLCKTWCVVLLLPQVYQDLQIGLCHLTSSRAALGCQCHSLMRSPAPAEPESEPRSSRQQASSLHLVIHLPLEEIPARRYPHDEGSTGQSHSVKPTLDACPEMLQVTVGFRKRWLFPVTGPQCQAFVQTHPYVPVGKGWFTDRFNLRPGRFE